MTGFEAACAAAWLLGGVFGTLATWLYLRGLTAAPLPDPGPFPPVLVLLPIQARDAAEAAQPEACLRALLAQDYPGPWRVVLAFEDAVDPAFRLSAMDPSRVSSVLAGAAEGRAQKVHNLLAALATRRAGEAVVATLDADTLPPPSWLAELTRPVRLGVAELAAGYRWWLPMGGLPARLGAIADRGPASFGRPRWLNLLWGGSTAISAAALRRLDVPGVWAGAVSDDMALTRAAQRGGLAPFTTRRVLVPSPVRMSWGGLLRFGRRQFVMVRVYRPLAWAGAGVALLGPTLAGAVVLAAAAGGSAAALAAVAAAVALQQARASLRAEIGRRVLPAGAAAALRAGMARDRLLLPLAHLAFVAAFLGSCIGRRVAWRGRRYTIRARDRVEVEPIGPGA